MQIKERQIIQIGEWSVDSLALTISKENEQHKLPAKVMAVLVYLAESHGRLVTRQELIDVVWDGNAYVGEKTLTNAIWRIRQLMGNDFDDKAFITTTPKIGYELVPSPVFSTLVAESPTGWMASNRTTRLLFVTALVLLPVAVAFQVFRSDNVLVVSEPLAVVTHLPGRELYAAPTPDGTRFAFMHVSPNGDQDLYIQSLVDTDQQPVKFTREGTSNFSPSWAPDGRHLAYVRINDSLGVCEIVVRDMTSAEETAIDECAPVAQKTLSWSPDGRWLVYRRHDPDLGPGLYLKAMNAEFRPTEELQDQRISCAGCILVDQEVSWSPDSRSIAVTRTKNSMSEDVYRFDLETWAFDRLTTDESSIEGHTWDETGEYLLYVSDRHSLDRRIWALDLTTKRKREVGYEGAGFPVYLPDYESIMFYRRRAQAYVVAVSLDLGDPGSRFPVTIVQTSGSDRNPAFSITAQKLAYYSNNSGFNEIWIAAPDGTNREQITRLETNSVYPSWSPDGRQIAFISFDPYTESTNIMIYDFASDSVELVSNSFADAGAPTWSSDGRSLIVPSWEGGDRVDLWRVGLDGNSIVRLTYSNVKFGRESPDGKSLVYSKAGQRGLFRMNYTDGSESRVVSDLVRQGFGSWTWANADEIFYSRHGGGHSQIVRHNLITNESRVVLRHPGRIMHRGGMLSYAEAENRLYFTHREPQQIDIIRAPDPLAGSRRGD